MATVHSRQISVPAGTSAHSVVLGDVNGDGVPDLVLAGPNGDNVGVLLGNGNGTFQTPQTLAAGNEAIAVVLGDVNGDGKTDSLSLTLSTARSACC